ncbi:MAG: outer membrane protein [Xanthobacteraceae bacterium]
MRAQCVRTGDRNDAKILHASSGAKLWTGACAGAITCISIFIGAQAAAADLNINGPPVLYDWTGLYLGGTVGGREVRGVATLSVAGAPSTIGGSDIAGTIVAGYSWAVPSWWPNGVAVIGLEIDASAAGPNITRNLTFGAETFNQTLANPWLSTMSVRFGVPVDSRGSLLVYGTAGVAFGNFVSTAAVSGPINGFLSGTSSRATWTAGVGVEYGINRYWSWKAEYLFVDTGDITFTTPSLPTGIFLTAGRITENIFRTGINFHF